MEREIPACRSLYVPHAIIKLSFSKDDGVGVTL
jgi:hypothetical protein